jgi:hypothetical protein
MATKGCDISDFIQDLLDQKNADGSRKYTEAQIRGKLKAALKSGLVSKAQIIASSGQTDLLATEAEFKKLEDFADTVANSKKSIFEIYSQDEIREFVTLANKAKNSIGTAGAGRLNQSRLTDVLNALNEVKPAKTTSILTVLDKSIEKAERNGDKARVAKLTKVKNSLMEMSDLSSRLKADWKAIAKTNSELEKLTVEYAMTKEILDIGDRETAAIKKNIGTKLLNNQATIQAVEKRTDLTDDEKAKQIEKLIIERQKLMQEYNEATSKKFKAARKKLEKKLKTLSIQVQRLKDNAPNSFLNKILLSVTGIDSEFFVTNLRELRERQLKTEEDIKLVEKIVEEYPEDKTFTQAEVHALFGEDYSSTKAVKEMFYENELNDDGSPKLDATNKVIKKRKESINLGDVKNLLSIWSDFKRNKSYEETISTVESTRINNIIMAGDDKLVSEIEPEDPLPIARTASEAKVAKVGYSYDPRKASDRVKGIKDLQTVLQRLSYLSSLPNHKGYISTGMLIGVLGTDAQSLFHRFDDAVMDDLELDNPVEAEGETTLEGRRLMLQTTLLKLGFTDAEVLSMPEFTDTSYVDNFSKVVAFDIEWEPNTDNVIAVSLVEYLNGNPVPVNTEVIWSSKGKTEYLTKDDAETVLQRLHTYQNNGFKVVGHNSLGTDSDMQKLVTVSGNTKLGMSVSLRSIDTMLLAFRNSPLGSFTRHYGPSLDNLSKALGTGSKASKAGVTGVTAHEAWKTAHATGDYTDFTDYLIQDTALTGRNLLEMVHKKNTTVDVNNYKGEPQPVELFDIVPIWYDTAKPEIGRNQKYNGINVLFDITSFRNMRETAGQGLKQDVMYDVGKLKNLATQMILALMKSENKDDIDTIFAAINAKEEDIIKNFDRILEISRSNHEAYLPILRQIREANGNQFLLDATRQSGADIVYSKTPTSTVYENAVLEEMRATLAAYNRNADKAINRFAELIGFRQRKEGENVLLYGKELFNFAATKFNNKELKITDFGDGTFDYVPAKQLGRGFAQIILGHIDDGLKLSQSIKTPLTVIDQRREEAELDGRKIEFEDKENLVEKREYLPITKQNVSYFAPLSMYEQERMYNDFALRQRYHYILNHDITADDVKNFSDWKAVNPILELKNEIKFRQALLKAFKEKKLKTEKDFDDIELVYFPSGRSHATAIDSALVVGAAISNEDKLKNLKSGINDAQKELTSYVDSLEAGRLEQGRVQRYNLHLVPNNRSIYSRIPTTEEMEEMALEIALDLPQFIATFVHDSVNLLGTDGVFLNGKNYWEMPELSAGGPTGAAKLAGIHPQLAWMMSNPELGRDPDMLKEVTRKSLENAQKIFATRGWSRTTYWDDNNSGIHHNAVMLWSYFPDEAFQQQGGLLQILMNIRDGNVDKNKLKDYYVETANQMDVALDRLEQEYTNAGLTIEADQIRKIKGYLNTSPEVREFFKGAVIPRLYEGGYQAILDGLRDKKKSKIASGDPIHNLSDQDIQKIAWILTETGVVVQGKLVDEILGLDSVKASKLIQLFLKGTERLTTNVKPQLDQIFKIHPTLKDNFISVDAAREGIKLRLRTIAEYTMPAWLERESKLKQVEWINKRVEFLEKKWQSRITAAENIIKANGGKIKIGSQAERDFHVALSGDQAAFKTQMTMMGINKMQNSGLKLNSTNRDVLEASVFTGRHIADSDLMFTDHVVFTTVGVGTGSGRAQYVKNYLTNLHGTRLSKGNRLVYKEDGVTIDWKETVQNSAWGLVGNPLTGKPRDVAREELKKLVIKNYLLTLATDYPPTVIGYNQDDESRSTFFKEWQKRSRKEKEWEAADRLNDRETLKATYATEGRTLTDEEIDQAIQSNSTPLNKRIGTRILAPTITTNDEDTVMSVEDAKGLAAFRPRLADNAFEDKMIHGLYTMYQGVKRLNLGTERVRGNLNKISEKGITPEKVFDMQNSRATQYDPEQLGVYFPETESSLVETIFGERPTFNQRVLRLKFILDTFARKNGLQDLIDAKEYATVYQIYKIRQQLKKFSFLVSQKVMHPHELRFLHRHLVQQIFKLTKAQRDATNSKRNILDITKALGIDPEKFKYPDGTNMYWIDVIRTLADLGVEEVSTIKFGMSPVEMLTTETTEAADVLQDAGSSIKPNVIQGSDVAIIFEGLWANDLVQKEATKFLDNLVRTGVITDYKRDQTGKFALLSTLDPVIEKQVLEHILNNDELIMAAAENLGLYVTLEIGAGENLVRLQNSKFHAKTDGAYVVPNRGLGPATTNRTVIGSQDVRFFLTPEAIKRILIGARNSGLFTRIETAVQVNKYIGTSTMVDQLRREKYSDYLDSHLDQLADETDILAELQGDSLDRLRTDRLKDKMGIELNLYNAEKYFTNEDDITGLTPFKNAVTLDIRIAAERAKQYPALATEYGVLNRLMTEDKNQEWFLRIGFAIFVKNNVGRSLVDAELRIILEEHFGEKLTDAEYAEFSKKLNQVISIIDRINHSPFKGKNKYLHHAIKHREQMLQIPDTFNYAFDVASFIKNFGIPVEDHAIAAQAVIEAYAIVEDKANLPEAYSTIPSKDLIQIANSSAEFEAAFPEGKQINAQLVKLKMDGVIDDETETFYRLLIGKVLKHNPNLAKFLSIKVDDLGTIRAGEAVKDGDRFIINLNPTILKNMGRVDQMRVFAHEIAHIARLAFIKDNSPEWRRIESLFKSKRGSQAIEVMLLTMNNNKRYEGFEQDLRYFRDNPEEFIAQWGGWMLLNNVFNNEDVMRFVQSRSSTAHAASMAYKTAFHRIRDEVKAIASGLDQIDDETFFEIMDLTESMFGFTSAVEREIYVANENKKLGWLGEFNEPISSTGGDLDTLAKLTKDERNGVPLAPLDQVKLAALRNKYKTQPIENLDAVQYQRIRREREAMQGVSLEKPSHRNHPGYTGQSVTDLSPEQKLEIAQTFVSEVISRRKNVSINTSSLGGAMRNASERMFGKKATRKLLAGRYYLGTMGLTQANKTYQNDHPIAAALMYVIGESFSHTQGQFVKDVGSRGIRENRAYSQQWVERVSYEIGQLKLMSSKDEFKTLMNYARDYAHGITTTAPTGISVDKIDQAKEVAKALSSNAINMKKFIYGGGADLFSDIPVMLDREILGLRKNNTNEAREIIFNNNREELISLAADAAIDSVVNNQFLNGTLFWASGLGPRIQAQPYEFNKNQFIDSDFIKEMKRVQNSSPETFEIIFEIAVRQLINNTTSESIARQMLRQSMLDSEFKVNGKPNLHRIWESSARQFYSLINQTRNKSEFVKRINKLGKPFKIPPVDIAVWDRFTNAVDLAMKSKDPIRNAGQLFVEDGNKSFPPGVSNIPAGKKSVMLLAGQKKQTLAEIMAGLYLAELGENPSYLLKASLITAEQIANDPKLNKFFSNRYDTMLVDIERSKGFRATSALAIQDSTGIVGFDIYDILDIFDSIANNIDPNISSQGKELKESLAVIRQKLEIEQGIQSRRLGEEDDFFTNLLLKWGPDITRLAYGPNLNTASLIMEGSLGALITARYGGNPVEFFTDLFFGFFRNYGSGVGNYLFNDINTYDPRGIAINMMYGIENGVRNARDIWDRANDHTEDGPNRYQRYKNLMSRLQNSVFRATAESLTNQAQRIVINHLNNGNLNKLRTLFLTEDIRNLDELKVAMNKYKIAGILPHLAFELKQTGLFEPGILEAYAYMLGNVKSKHAKEGTLDFVAANKWIENTNFTALFTATNKFTKEQASRAVAAGYEATKMFRNIVLVESNPWDSDTHSGVLRFLFTFYKQYSNLMWSQKVMRLSGKMDVKSLAAALIATTIADLLYNSFLMVALGMIPLTALLPWHENFIFKTKPMTAVRLILSRNPIFGLTGNLIAGSAAYAYETYSDLANRSANRNQYMDIKRSVGKGYDELGLDFVPQQAIETMTKDPLTSLLIALTAGANMTEQESWDFKNGLMNPVLRVIPGIGEAPVRTAITKLTLGDRPGLDRYGQVSLSRPDSTSSEYDRPATGSTPTFTRPTTSSPQQDNVLKPLKVPKGL